VVPMLPTRPTRRPPGQRRPLPDPVAARQVRVPDSAPPYEGAGAEPTAAAGGPDEPPDPPGASPPGPVWTPRAEPGPGGWPSQFAQALAEALAGSRPAQQLNPWTTEQTRQQIRQLGPVLATSQRPRVRRLMTSAPAADVLELTAVVGFGPRVRVLAVRLERAGQAAERWRCTAIESA
jgi:hypothetical protein